MKKVGIIGSGIVAKTLAKGFIHSGYEVLLGSRNPDQLNDWIAQTDSNLSAGSFSDAAKFADLVVLAVKGSVAEKVVEGVKYDLTDKTVIDTCNPIAETGPVNGVLPFFTGQNESLLERLQTIAPNARFVKSFSCIGNAYMVHPSLPEKPSMFICGNDERPKRIVAGIVSDFGHEVEDMGAAEAARAIEPLCMLWCIPGFLGQGWNHAFRLIKG